MWQQITRATSKKEKRKTVWKVEERCSKGFKHNGNKKQAGGDTRPSGMEDDFIGSQGPKRTLVLEEEEEEEVEEEEEMEKKNNNIEVKCCCISL